VQIAGGSRQWRADEQWRGGASGGGGGGGSSCTARSERRVHHSRQADSGDEELRGDGWMAAASVGVLEVVAIIVVCVV
jgi:hypothetical protein